MAAIIPIVARPQQARICGKAWPVDPRCIQKLKPSMADAKQSVMFVLSKMFSTATLKSQISSKWSQRSTVLLEASHAEVNCHDLQSKRG